MTYSRYSFVSVFENAVPLFDACINFVLLVKVFRLCVWFEEFVCEDKYEKLNSFLKSISCDKKYLKKYRMRIIKKIRLFIRNFTVFMKN